MATKKDLIEAQTFSRRRLLTAFTSGAPGGKELEPAKPLRAVVASVALALMVVLVGLFWGLMKPGLPDGWESNTVVLVDDTGSRFVAMDGTLYPAVNTTSARLLIPAGEYQVVATDSSNLADIPVGPAVGITGAPDDVPAPDHLIPTAWSACVADQGTAVTLPQAQGVSATSGAALVTADAATWVVAGGVRYAVDARGTDAVLRAIGLEEAIPVAVESRWLNLFAAGPPLEPLRVEDAGSSVAGTTLVVGAVVAPTGAESKFLVTPEGELRPLSALEFQLYQLGTGATLGGAREIAPADIASLPTAPVTAAGPQWPEETLTPLDPTLTPCATLTHSDASAPVTTLATVSGAPQEAGVAVAVGGGVLARIGGAGEQAAHVLTLVDQTGTAFPLPGADAEVLARLGYSADDTSEVPQPWAQFFFTGPALTVGAAGQSPDAVMQVDSAGPGVRAAAGGQCEPGTIEYAADRPEPLSLLQADAAHQVATGRGVTVAVVDSGIDITNAHLAAAVVGGINLVGDDASDGYVDIEGHGTAVAGAIAAREVEGSGVVGVAPQADLLAVRVYRATDEQSVDAGFGPRASVVAEGIAWAVDHGADVINVSLSHDGDDPAVAAAVAKAHDAGVVVVASGGNASTAESALGAVRYPAGYPGVIGVSATDLGGMVTASSIPGPHIDVAAPGQRVLTSATGAGDCIFAVDSPQTSFATAYTSGAVALVREAHPGDSVEELTYRLTASAVRATPDQRDDAAGWGVIQPYDAMTWVPGSSERGPVNPGASAAPVSVGQPTVVLASTSVESPLTQTRELMAVLAVAGVTALSALVTLVVMRRRREAMVATVEPRPGLLDALRSHATDVVDRTDQGGRGSGPRAQ